MVKLNFEVQTKKGSTSYTIKEVSLPSQYPCFVLNHNWNWNDFGYYTWYSLFYFRSEKEVFFLGELKILHAEFLDTNSIIPKTFTKLDENFCSLGITPDFYRNLKRQFSTKECYSILSALQDCSIQIEHYERFKDTEGYQISLCRELSSERAWREAKYIINGTPLKDAYSIHFLFHPKYNPKCIAPFILKFNPEAKYYNRCAGIIGENGVGKTTMLSNLIDCLINNKKDCLNGKLPLFSCVMSICTTPFDSFSNIKKNIENPSIFPYYYFCADQKKDNIIDTIIESVLVIRKKNLNKESIFQKYDLIIRKYIPDLSSYQLWYENVVDEGDKDGFTINNTQLLKFIENSSSGQLQLFLLITFIFRQITFDSLVIIDEPEVHLHPKAIRDLFKLLMYLLNQFQSYCIVSTHSPLVVRELPGQNVYLMRRIGNIPEVGKIGIETLGENISILYDEIFGYDDNKTYLNRVITRMKSQGKNYKEIIRLIKSDENKLNLNARFIVKHLVGYEKSKESKNRPDYLSTTNSQFQERGCPNSDKAAAATDYSPI